MSDHIIKDQKIPTKTDEKEKKQKPADLDDYIYCDDNVKYQSER